MIDDAVKYFESHVLDADLYQLRVLSVQDVLDAARLIEREREEQDALCNLRRIEPLLSQLQGLSIVLGDSNRVVLHKSYLWVCGGRKNHRSL